MASFDKAISLILRHEGGFVDDPRDSGGATNHGISLRFYKKSIKPDATIDDIRNLSQSMAASIYLEYFWNKQPYSQIDSQHIANRVFDLSVNMGAAHANACLQQAVNSCIGSHLVIDGQLGHKSLEAINSLAPENLLSALLDQAELYYKHIVEQHPQDSVFLHGWLNRLHA